VTTFEQINIFWNRWDAATVKNHQVVRDQNKLRSTALEYSSLISDDKLSILHISGRARICMLI